MDFADQGNSVAEPVAVDSTSVRQSAKGLNPLAALAMPHVMEFLFPPLYVYFWGRCIKLLTQTDTRFPKLALGIPRGHAKTMFLKLLILFIILYTKRRFILVICARADLANAVVSDVVDMLSHDNIRNLFGNWDEDLEIDRQDTKRFTFRGRTVILKGVGQGTSFRGISEKLARPDVMIFDDSQTKECASSETTALEYAQWFRGTAMKAKDPKFCFYLYVGNIYAKLELAAPTKRQPEGLFGCMLKNLKNSRHWESIIVGAILADGTALWEELQSLEQLLDEYQEDIEAGQEEVFLAEVMNDDEAVNTNLFDETKVPPYPFAHDVTEQASYLIIDPSLGKSTSDDQQVGHFKVIDGHTVLWEVRNMQCSAPDLVRQCIDWCLEENIPAICIENYAYQASLGQWFEAVMNPDSDLSLDGISGLAGIEILLVSHGRASKNSRIKSMLKEVMGGDLIIHPQAKAILYSEITTFNPLKTNNRDNTLDVATYGNPVKHAFPQQIQCNILLTHGRSPNYSPEVVDSGMTHG